MAGSAELKQRTSQKQQQGRSNNRKRSREAGVAKTVCAVCKEVEGPKYKCPKCRASYCSIQCCRDHKAKGCSSKTFEEESPPKKSMYLPKEEILVRQHKTTRTVLESEYDADDDLEGGWKITDAMKEALQQSEWLKRELDDIGLRQIVTTIVSKPKQAVALDQAKSDYPHFKHFMDKLLVTSGILQRNEVDADQSLEEWLARTDSRVACSGLNLKPIHDEMPIEELQSSQSLIDKERCDNESWSDDGESSSDGE